MALKKKKIKPISKKSAISKRKKAATILKTTRVRNKSLSKKGALKASLPDAKKAVVSDVTDLYERARWKKERREYWRNRFRKILNHTAAQAKAKK